MMKYYKLLLLALGLSLTLNASASHLDFLTLPDYQVKAVDSKKSQTITPIEITGVVGQPSTKLDFLIKNNTKHPLKLLRYSASGQLNTSMLQYVEPIVVLGTETGRCFIPGTLSPDTAVAPHNTCTASFIVDTSHISTAGHYKFSLVIQDEWDVRSNALLVDLHMYAPGGATGDSLAAVPDTSEAYFSPAVKRILVHNLKATTIPKLSITMTPSDNAFIVYDGKNGNEDSHKGPWCTDTTCPNHCVADDGLAANAICYIYIKAKSDVAIGAPEFATLKVGDSPSATGFSFQLANQSVLYAAGNFTDHDGYHYVAEYDGSDWYNIGSGPALLPFNGLVGALATDVKGNLYAGGNFNLLGLPQSLFS